MKNKILGLCFCFMASVCRPALAEWVPSRLTGGAVKVLAVSTASPPRIFAGTVNGLYVSEDDGATWRNRILSYDGTGKIDFLSVFDVAVFNQNIFFATSKGIYQSRDAGTKIVRLHVDTPEVNRMQARFIKPVSFPDKTTAIAFVAKNGVALTYDQGLSFKWFSSPDVGDILDVAMLKETPVVMTSSGVFNLTASGFSASSWKDARLLITVLINTPQGVACLIQQNDTSLLRLYPAEGGGSIDISSDRLNSNSPLLLKGAALYVGGKGGLFSVNWEERTLAPFGGALPKDITTCVINPQGTFWVAGTAGAGVWRLSIP